jgi:hypothetical protein
MAEFLFDEATHAYTLDGRRLPSVTQIIKPLASYGHIPVDVLARKMALGTAVHLACDLDDAGELDDAATDPEVLGYVTGWRQYLAAVQGKVLASERRAYHRTLGFAGTLDRVVLVEGKHWLIDLKTGADPMPSWGVQLAAYQLLLEDGGDLPVHVRAAVRLQPGGDFRIDPFRNPNDAACFRACLSIHQWKESNQ